MKKVALVLGSGGARGLAHIGAIEELERRGYQITSIAGCSMGSLIGGIYAAGKLSEAREWFTALTKQQIFALTDISLGMSYLVKGTRVMDAIKAWVPDCLIEKLPIPAAFVATDMLNSSEYIFRSGKLFDAIRASISIPMCFEPVAKNGSLLVDGGLTNPLPLNRVERTEGDILVGINLTGRTQITLTPRSEGNIDAAWAERLGRFKGRVEGAWKKLNQALNENFPPQLSYIEMLNRTVDLQMQANTRLMIETCPPDVLVDIPQDAYTTFDFDKAADIIEYGRKQMSAALDKFC